MPQDEKQYQALPRSQPLGLRINQLNPYILKILFYYIYSLEIND